MKKITTTEFIENFYKKYPNGLDLDLSNFNYKSSRFMSETICKIHKSRILNSANNLMQGIKRCKQCKSSAISTAQLYTINDFIKKSKIAHGEKYDYSLVNWVNSRTNVIIICNKHGQFEQNPQSHWAGYGCRHCGYKTLRKSIFKFIEDAVQIHGTQYSYLDSEYTNNYTKIKIICKKHGEFFMSPVTHVIYQRGCPDCYLGNSSWIEIRWLNELNVPLNCRQIRLTIDGISFIVDGKIGNTIYEFWGDFWHGNPNKFSPELKNTKCGKTFKELYEATMNKRKLIKEAGYNLVECWESDYIKELKRNPSIEEKKSNTD